MVRVSLVCGLLLTLSLIASADEKSAAKLPKVPTNPGLEKMKKLAGTWMASKDDNMVKAGQVVSVIKVTAGGSAVHETLFPGTPMEMISVYTAEGPDVVLTHYCVLGNQPRMKADGNSSSNQLHFKFAGGTNLDPAKDKHMHEAKLTLIDDDHLELSGVAWEGGVPSKEKCCDGMKLVRQK